MGTLVNETIVPTGLNSRSETSIFTVHHIQGAIKPRAPHDFMGCKEETNSTHYHCKMHPDFGNIKCEKNGLFRINELGYR